MLRQTTRTHSTPISCVPDKGYKTMRFKMNLAGTVISIEHKYDLIRSISADHIADEDEKEDFSVSVDEHDIKAEKELSGDVVFSNSALEATCIHRKIVEKLLYKGSIIIHSAVVEVDGASYAFLAKSGVGKSTHVRMWLDLFSDNAKVINGDKPMFAFENGRFTVYGSPWKGKEGWGCNTSSPVKAMCFLERGETNEIRRAAVSEILPRLFNQVLMPSGQDELAIFMNIIDRIVTEVPFYILRCNISREAAEVAYRGMK